MEVLVTFKFEVSEWTRGLINHDSLKNVKETNNLICFKTNPWPARYCFLFLT